MIQDMLIVAIGASSSAVQSLFMICKVFLLDEMNAKLLHLIFSGVCIEAGAVQRAPMAIYCLHVHFSGIFGMRHILVISISVKSFVVDIICCRSQGYRPCCISISIPLRLSLVT
jgi:hypothetical protein